MIEHVDYVLPKPNDRKKMQNKSFITIIDFVCTETNFSATLFNLSLGKSMIEPKTPIQSKISLLSIVEIWSSVKAEIAEANRRISRHVKFVSTWKINRFQLKKWTKKENRSKNFTSTDLSTFSAMKKWWLSFDKSFG